MSTFFSQNLRFFTQQDVGENFAGKTGGITEYQEADFGLV